MIAPVYVQNAKGRYVYLPEEMCMIRMRSLEDMTSQVIEKGCHYIEMALNELVIFVKKNHVLPLAVLENGVRTTADLAEADIKWLGFVEEPVEYVFYDDDGISGCCIPEKDWRRVTVRKTDLLC